MLAALGLALLATASGAAITYLYDTDAPLVSRTASGAPIGLALLGLMGFAAASVLGLTPFTVALASAASASPLLLLGRREYRLRVRADLEAATRDIVASISRPSSHTIACLVFYSGVVVTLWLVFDRVMFERPDGIYTGVVNNLGDLPFHISVVTRFAYGQNFPPEDPTFAGARFTYPFLADFIAAMFVRVGASLRTAMLIENLALALALVGLLHRFALELVRDRLAALISPVITLIGGGLGWWLLLEDAGLTEVGILGLLQRLPREYSLVPGGPFRWGNAITCLLTTQRSLMLGLPLAMIALIEFWRFLGGMGTRGEAETTGGGRAGTRPGIRRMIAAGVVAGMLPLVHAHSFVVVIGVGTCLALFGLRACRSGRPSACSPRGWIAFFGSALLAAAPQIVWSVQGSSVQPSKFLGWHVGWDRGEHGVFAFWLLNTGAFIPLLIAGLLLREKDRSLSRCRVLFFAPFALCFIVPNLLKLAPWIWDNIKVLFYFYAGSAPLVALALARFWRRSGVSRWAAVLFFVALTLAGALDVFRVVSRSAEYLEFDRDAIAFAGAVDNIAAPHSLIVHAPVHDHPVFLTGRRSLMGYPGHIWTHGIDYSARQSDIRAIYGGAPNSDELLTRYGVDYVVVSSLERREMRVNDGFFERFDKVAESGDYRLYRIGR